jgi:hypothetical protein
MIVAEKIISVRVEISEKRPSLTPREFRALTGWSVYKIERETEIPLGSLYCYLKDEGDPNYRAPKPFVNRLLGELYLRCCRELPQSKRA